MIQANREKNAVEDMVTDMSHDSNLSLETDQGARSGIMQLTDKILLNIVKHAVATPEVIHGDRFESLRLAPMKKIGPVNLRFSNLVPEVVYSNKVIFKAFAPNDTVVTKYPKPKDAKWVRELDFEAYLLR